jgi:mono/diheme cytochrome c family protein
MKLLLAIFAVSALPAQGTGEGRSLYQFGTGSPPVLMKLPGDTAFASGSAMACAACHGVSGSGTEERIAVPDFTQVAATARNPQLFARVLERGIAGDGHALRMMPRYAMNVAQRQSLADYVTALSSGSPPEPGLTDSAIVIGIDKLAEAPRRDLLAYATEHPQTIYGRRLHFSMKSVSPFAQVAAFMPPDPSPQDTPVMTIASDSPGAGRATVLLIAELLRRSGRRLTQPGFAAALEQLRKQEIEP